MKLGFTGTQTGMTQSQKYKFRILLDLLVPSEFHHGECIGADEDAHLQYDAWRLEAGMTRRIIVHPPIKKGKRSKLCRRAGTDLIWEEKEYMARNKDIVTESDILVATPFTLEEQLRSGTWATVRMARRLTMPIMLLAPNGEVVVE